MKLKINAENQEILNPNVVRILEKILLAFTKKELNLKVKTISINWELITSAKMRSINYKYRNKNKTTDVLSFPLYDLVYNRTDKLMKKPEMMSLGDIFISESVAKKQAREFKISLQGEILHLLVHGYLHLLGFDHEKSNLALKLMEKHEKNILDQIYKKIKVSK